MRPSVLIDQPSATGDEDLRQTAVSDLPAEPSQAGDIPQPGVVLDQRYEITGILGHGGMGHVLAARHVVLGQRIAIKVLRPEMTRDDEIVERFRREARAASAIGHAGIVQVKDFGALPSGASYYVMEHVEGVGLADALEKDGPFTVERAVDVVKQMADALGAAHEAGIIHRDVKPDNVILTSFHGRADHVKLLDFGIAKLDFASRLSGAHRVLGTPAYMSPEQCRGQKLDRRCDVYALGVVFYELLTGTVPFDDARPLEVLRQQIQVEAPSVQLLRPDVPDAIADVIARCLAKKPEDRPDGMGALAELLAPFVVTRSMGFGASTPSPTPAPAPRPAIAVTLTPVVREAPTRPSPAPSVARPTPEVVAPHGTRRRPIALALGVVLTVIGVAALAAAGGILARERSDAAAPPTLTQTAPAVPAPEAPIPVVASAPPAEVPSIVAVPSTPAPEIASPPPAAAHPPEPRHVPRARPAHAATPAPSPAAPSPPPRVEHPTIQVMDPWS